MSEDEKICRRNESLQKPEKTINTKVDETMSLELDRKSLEKN